MTIALSPNPRRGCRGFTLLELAVVLAVTGLLASLLFVTSHSTEMISQSSVCLSNQKQLMLAWHMYSADNNDLLAPNDYPYTTAYWGNANSNQLRNWVVGTMEQPIDAKSTSSIGLGPGALELMDSNTVLSRYIKNIFIWRCPADNYVDPKAKTVHPRSYSMNDAIGTIYWSSFAGGLKLGSPVTGGWLSGSSYNSGQNSWQTYGKMSGFGQPGPANTFCIMDENANSINDGTFEAAGATIGTPPTGGYEIDFPAAYHNTGAAISFVDGHAIIHTWLNSNTYTPAGGVQSGGGSTSTTSNPNLDMVYLASITTAPK